MYNQTRKQIITLYTTREYGTWQFELLQKLQNYKMSKPYSSTWFVFKRMAHWSFTFNTKYSNCKWYRSPQSASVDWLWEVLIFMWALWGLHVITWNEAQPFLCKPVLPNFHYSLSCSWKDNQKLVNHETSKSNNIDHSFPKISRIFSNWLISKMYTFFGSCTFLLSNDTKILPIGTSTQAQGLDD